MRSESILFGQDESVNSATQEIEGTVQQRDITPKVVVNIKKIPKELRREKKTYPFESDIFKKFLRRLKEDSQFLRSTVQLAFALLCVWIGIEFYLFVEWGLSDGAKSFVARPPGAEGFLPISALMSVKYWIETGVINNVHPASIFILLAIIGVSLLLKKAFCSWMCPIGTLSEALWKLGEKIFGKNLSVNRWIDYPLRSLKYFLLFFFVWAILQMDVRSLATFIYSPYNKVADIKMYLFFANISNFALWSIIVLMVLSVIIKNFWCRFLCPYGALLGFISFFSPIKIVREKSTCIDCELCTKACPSSVKVHKVGKVWSDECTACLECVEACPVKETLVLKSGRKKEGMPPYVFGALVVGVFVAITGIAMLSGNWQNEISKEEYQKRFKELDSPLYQHFQGEVPQYGPND